MSEPPMEPEHLVPLRDFVELCKANPLILHRPELAFMKSFVEYFNGKIPEEKTGDSEKSNNENECKTKETKLEAEDDSEESDLELDMTGVIDYKMSEPPMEPEHLVPLRVFVELCKANPLILHRPELAFMKSFVEYFNGKIPEEKTGDSEKSNNENECKTKETKLEAEDDSEESDLELDMTGVIRIDNDVPQIMGNPTLQPTEEDIAESQAKRSEAVSAFVEKNYEKAIDHYTEAIVLNPQVALLNAKRGQIYLLLNKPNACIRDCNRALELNPDSAAAHKFRGRAYYLLGKWEEAASDLRLACKFDFDEQADEWLREATKNARKIEEHKRKKERKLKEKLERAKQEEIRKTKESAKTREDNTRPSQTDSQGAAGWTPGMNDFYQVLSNPQIVQALIDPEVAEAIKEISKNPMSILKYQNNPKIAAFITEISKIYNIDSSDPRSFAAMRGGMPGFSGTNPPPRCDPPKSPQPQDDVGLD